jgi:Xaa-Pro dipeptidase
MGHLERLQDGMRRDGFDALLLGGEAAGQFAAGYSRIGVHMPGWPIPVAFVPASGLPHIVTADPDGAVSLPADHVHGMMWNPETLVSELSRWLEGASGLTIGVDALSPGGVALIQAAAPGSTIVDATVLLAEVMLPKTAEEVAALGDLCGFVTAAAEEGLRGGRPALLRALHGAFLISYPHVSARRVQVAVRRGGLVAEARLGPGDPDRGARALSVLRPGSTASQLAGALPAGVEVVGLGWSYEAPLIRDGWGTPEGLVLQPGAVLGVRWDSCGVTVAIESDGPRLLSLSPKEVVR